MAIDIATTQFNVGADQANARLALFIDARGIDGKHAAHATGLNVQFQVLNDKLNTLRQLGFNLLAAVAQVAQHLGTIDAGMVGGIDTIKRGDARSAGTSAKAVSMCGFSITLGAP